MAERAEHGGVERVPYRPLETPVERAGDEPRIQHALDRIEALETALAGQLSDPRLAKRLRRVVRQEASAAFREGALTDGWPRPGLRPASIQEAVRYTAVVAELAEIQLPRDAAELALLHGRLTEEGRVPFRTVPAELRGSTRVVTAPEPPAIPAAVERALERAATSPAHPAVAGALLAGEILTIRPFKRGDPLLSRLLLRLVLQSNGLATIGDYVVDRTVDLGHLTTVDVLVDSMAKGSSEQWVMCVLEHLAAGLEETYADAQFAKRYLEVLNERQWRLTDWFRRETREHPERLWRFRDIHAAFSYIPQRTLKRDLATLRDAEILDMEGKLKSARYRFIIETTPESLAVRGMS